jgi:predicted RNase H-like HicB family nuclease
VEPYTITIRKERNEDYDPPEWYVGSSAELPTAFGDGATVEECFEVTRQALIAAVVTLLEGGIRPPIKGKRTAQINVRLMGDEKLVLAAAAERHGLSVSDFIRTTALRQIS